MLLPKHERFVQEYLIHLDAKKAAELSGFSKKTAKSIGQRVLNRPDVQAALKKAQAEIRERNNITIDMVIQELASLGFYNVQDILTEQMTLENLKKLDRKYVKPIIGIEVTEFKSQHKQTARRKNGTTIKIRLADKVAALQLLGKHVGAWEADNRQKSQKIKVTLK